MLQYKGVILGDVHMSIDVLYEVALDRLDAQIRRIDGIDHRLGMTFGLANGILAALVAFMVFATPPIPQTVLIFTRVSAASYGVSLFFLCFAYLRYRLWSFRPDPSKLRSICGDPTYLNYPNIVKDWVAKECIKSTKWNGPRITRKVKHSFGALVATSVEGGFLAASAIVYFMN